MRQDSFQYCVSSKPAQNYETNNIINVRDFLVSVIGNAPKVCIAVRCGSFGKLVALDVEICLHLLSDQKKKGTEKAFNVANSLSNSIFGIQKPISVRDQFSVLLTLLFSKKEAGHTASARSFVILLSPFPERDSQDSSDKLFTAH
ncbi:hypothetical protein JTE90_005912 [Oedothorax gibbosus]|uniref:Uncharacterized protein n=1 Tax=Oedothorax gibbosus TaxID=931172 RepID=A0AAV6U945_9ARAC|nr:hypothetical protein JTE90_005912 [Oedothorax gibbosus]